MKKTLAIAAAATLLTATVAFAQSSTMPAQAPASSASGNTMMKGKAAPKMQAPADSSANAAAGADTSADTGAAKPKAHHRMAKNEAAMNASEAETTRQLNEQQAQMAKGGGSTTQ
jgi:hypothetical protein